MYNYSTPFRSGRVCESYPAAMTAARRVDGCTRNRIRRIAILSLSIFITFILALAPALYGVARAQEATSPTTEPTDITTGNATSGLDLGTTANFTDTTVDILPENTTSSTIDETLPSPPDSGGTEDVSSGTQDSDSALESALQGELSDAELLELLLGEELSDNDISATTTNIGTIGNTASVTAETGESSAMGTSSTITTGDAIAYANVVNIVNTNIFNSDGLIKFFNQVLGIDTLDLRDAFSMFESSDTAMSTPSCASSICSDDSSPYTLNLDTTNDATITNDLVVRAITGGNEVGADGSITTGDAYAAANVFNIANTNITDSNYLIVSFNNFGDYAGDIVLPSANIFNSLFSAQGAPLDTTVTTGNDATIDNTLDATAETGGNTGADGSTLSTGDATTDTSVHNVVNTNLFGGSDLLLVLRVHGDWSGDVFGLPEGLAWTETDQGIVLYNTGDSNIGGTSVSETSIAQNNTASILNDVSVFALTGENKVGAGGTIETGNAYAAANVTNVANTNILGQNWALLIFDIFGDWSGNLAFGQPDLWVGGQATAPQSPIMPGTEVTYTYTITNKGDAPATDVTLDNAFNEAELGYVSDTGRITRDDRGVRGSWNIGTVAPGETREVSFTARVQDSLDRSLREISTETSVAAHENDANADDNTEVLTIVSGQNSGGGGGGGSHASKPSSISIEKTANVDAVESGGSADYTITLTNTGGPLYDAHLHDVMFDEHGATTSDQLWDLDTIRNGETITITYTTQFGANVAGGLYTNNAYVTGLSRYATPKKGKPYRSQTAVHTLTLGDSAPQVLGASTHACEPYLTTYMRRGMNNDSAEVLRLQMFLNENINANIPPIGIFGPMTHAAVRTFQEQYANEILAPWGMTQGTGYVYQMTQKKINELACAHGGQVLGQNPSPMKPNLPRVTPTMQKSTPPAPVPLARREYVQPATTEPDPAPIDTSIHDSEVPRPEGRTGSNGSIIEKYFGFIKKAFAWDWK